MNDKIINAHLDLAIDGADEVGPNNSLIKGGGAALLKEKIIAYNSSIFIIVADSTKLVKGHGTGFALPVEIIPEARVSVIRELEKLGASCVLRQGVKKAGPVITDNGNMLVDCKWSSFVNASEMEDKIDDIVGVVECGFFTKLRPIVFVSDEDGNVKRID